MIRRALLAIVPSLVGLVVALLLGALVIAATGKWPNKVALNLWNEFTPLDLGEALYYATIFTFTGLSVAYAFKASLFNIGGEGQLVMGGFTMGIVGAALPPATPAIVALPVCLASAFAAGAATAAIPAILRARYQVHEVITTILMNGIAGSAVVFLLGRYRLAHKELSEAVHTLPVVEGARVLDLGKTFESFDGSHANTLIYTAIGTAALVWWVVNKTRTGFELRAVGLNAEAAHATGISVPSVITKALLVSGGLAGLAAAPFVLSDKFYFEQGMLSGAGFTGIAVAVLAGNDGLRVVISAFLMALLTQAGQVLDGGREDQVRKEIVLVLTAVVIVSVLVAQGAAKRLVARAEARRARHAD